MRRREFLELVTATALGVSWLERAFADASVHEAAPRLDGPTLVLVIPRDDAGKWARGRLFGELLEFGSDRDLAPLALVDIVCLPASRLGIAGEPLMLYVDGETRVLDLALPERASAERVTRLSRLIQGALAKRRAADPRGDRTLAAIARARWVRQAPRGTHWATDDGCGVTVEGAPELADQVDCGMGHVPEHGRRFLYFFTRARR